MPDIELRSTETATGLLTFVIFIGGSSVEKATGEASFVFGGTYAGRSVETATARARIVFGQLLAARSTETVSSKATLLPGRASVMNTNGLLSDVLRLWGCGCDVADECIKADAVAVLNAAIQFIHANGRELPYLAERTRYYLVDAFAPASPTVLKLDADIQIVNGNVRAAVPWRSFFFRLNLPTNVPFGFNPFGLGQVIALSFESDAFRVTIEVGGLNAEMLQAAIQALITNEARVWVTYRTNMYLKITFDVEPVFIVNNEHNQGAAMPEIATIDFNPFEGNANALRSKGVVLGVPGSGSTNLIWFIVDGIGTLPPTSSDFAFDLPITNTSHANEWADSFAALVNGNLTGEFTATALDGVVTLTNAFNVDESAFHDGTPPTNLPITILQIGSDGIGDSIENLFPHGPDACYIGGGAESMYLMDRILFDAGDVPEPLMPVGSRNEIDHYVELYGDTPRAYFLERQHINSPDSAQVYLRFAPPFEEDAIVALDVQIEPARLSWSDFLARTEIPVPHQYVESILLPIARFMATSNHRYKQKERHENLMAQYKLALTTLKVVDPQVSGISEGKEATVS